MKNIIATLFLGTFTIFNAQTDAFHGRGDTRFQVGLNVQEDGRGLFTSLDYGLGESFSIGARAVYLLGVNELDGFRSPDFGERFDLNARFNANLGGVIGLPSNIDIYPGLNIGLHNFGGHAGFRYFFTKGFGVFGEFQFPISKYSDKTSGYYNLNNQTQLSIGASFDISR